MTPEPVAFTVLRAIHNNASEKNFNKETLLIDLEIETPDKYRVALEIEQTLNIDIEDDAIDHWETVGDVVETVKDLTV